MVRRPPGLVKAYYLATPLFALLDFGLGVNVRLAGLDGHAALRAAWYAAAIGCAALVVTRPGLASRVAGVEGAATLAALFLGVLVPYWDLVGTLASEQADASAGVASLRNGVANLLLTGAVIAAARLGGAAGAGVDGRLARP